jgi:hypothetical protein
MNGGFGDHLMKSLDDLIADSKAGRGGNGFSKHNKHNHFLKKGIQKNKSYLHRGEDTDMQ